MNSRVQMKARTSANIDGVNGKCESEALDEQQSG